jgi:hypothetical protein|tara:strand:+ start:177 stop:1145 length:969 start_codon:yes stop_codon:yes gene_type:complete
MKKIVNLTLENRFVYYFPIDFDLKKLNQLKPKFIGESPEDFIQYLFNNVFINPNELAIHLEQQVEKNEKAKSSVNFSKLYKEFSFTSVEGDLFRDNLPEINTTWLNNNIDAKNALNLSSIKKWQGKKFPNSSTANKKITFKEFDFFEGYLAPDPGSTYFLTNPDHGGFYDPFSSYIVKNKNNEKLKKQLVLYFKLIEHISYPMSFDSNILSKLSPPFLGNSFEDFKKYLKSNIEGWNDWENLPEPIWNEELSDWLRSNLKILGSDFIESVKEWSGINTRRELDVEDVFDSHCVDYETLGVDLVEDNKSEDFGNWNFNQLEMY